MKYLEGDLVVKKNLKIIINDFTYPSTDFILVIIIISNWNQPIIIDKIIFYLLSDINIHYSLYLNFKFD